MPVSSTKATATGFLAHLFSYACKVFYLNAHLIEPPKTLLVLVATSLLLGKAYNTFQASKLLGVFYRIFYITNTALVAKFFFFIKNKKCGVAVVP